MKRTLLMLLALLMVFSVISCQGNTPSSNQPTESTVNVKVDIKTDRSIKDIQEYGNLYVAILSGNEKEFNFNNLIEVTKRNSTIVEPVKLTSDKTDIYVYVIAADEEESQQKKVKDILHNTNITKADVEVSIIAESGKTVSQNKTVDIYVEDVIFVPKEGETPKETKIVKRINATDIFRAVGESKTSFSFATEGTLFPKAIGEYRVEVDPQLGYKYESESNLITEIVKDNHEEETINVGISFLSETKPSSDIFDFGNEPNPTIEYGDIFYLENTELTTEVNKDRVKEAFDKGALIMMNGGNLDDVKALFKAIGLEEKYISIDKMSSDSYVWFVGKYTKNIKDSTYQSVMFDYLDTKEASKKAVALMGRYIVTSYYRMPSEVENEANTLPRGLEERDDLLKHYAAAVRVSQKLYQNVPIKYTWNYLRQGFSDALKDYAYLGEGGRELKEDDYITDVHYRTLSIWFVHEYPKRGEKYGTHYYYVIDSPSFNYAPTYFGVVNQAVGNDISPYNKFGGGGSPISGAKTQEWYGSSAKITFEPVNPEQVEYIMDSPKTQDMDVTKTSEISWGLEGKGNVGAGPDGPQGGAEFGFNLGISNSMSWTEKGVQILRYTDASKAKFKWEFKPRGAWYWFAPFWGGGSSAGELGVYPSWSAITTLSPESNPQYIFSVSDEYVQNVNIKLIMESTLERSAGKCGIMSCVGQTTAKDEKIITIPYDKWYNYETKQPITENDIK